jgi:hypothetical protein
MTTQYTTILKLALPVQGELSGTWGDVVNDNITQMVEQAVAGKAVINTWTANSHTLTTADGTTSESRCAILELTDSGTALTGAGTVVCPTNTKLYIVDNNTAEIITVQTAAGTGVAVPVGKTMLVYCDGTNVVEGVTHANSLSLGTSTSTVNAIDTATDLGAGSSSNSNLPTQLAVKTYVDGQIAATNELSEVLAAGNTTGANDIDVDSAQKVQFRDADIYLNSSVDGQLDIVADGEVQIDTALVDINGNLDVSGTTNISGSVSFTKNAIAGVAISTTSRSSNTVTVTTSAVHGLTSGDLVNVNGVADTSFNGYFTASVSSTTVFTYSQTGADGSSTGGTSTEVVYNLNASGTALNWMNGPLNIAANSGIDGLEITQSGSGEALSITGGNAIFGDNDKAVFGAGSDLEIYHDGSDSYVKDNGAGDLIIQAYDDIKFQQSTDNADLVTINTGGNVTIHGGNLDVTGTVTADGLTVDGGTYHKVVSTFPSTYVTNLQIGQQGNINNDASIDELLFNHTGTNAASNTLFKINSKNVLNIESGGDISFYEDTGTTAKLFWDASEERLGIGTSSPTRPLDVNGSGIVRGFMTLYGTGTDNALFLHNTAYEWAAYTNASNYFVIEDWNLNQKRLTIDTSGNVGIGTSSPSEDLHVSGTGDRNIAVESTNTGAGANAGIKILAADGGDFLWQTGNATGNALRLYDLNATAERIRINSSGHTMFATTDDAPGAGNTQSGVAIRGGSDNRSFFSVSSNYVAAFNRNTNDGPIVEFNKDGAGVGSIGANGGRPYLVNNVDGGIHLSTDGYGRALLLPADQNGAPEDNLHYLGSSSYRWRDLYLSGGVVFGTTGGAVTSKTLDDYEEGAWTPVLASDAIAGGYTTQVGKYTKIGNVVNVSFNVQMSSIGSFAGAVVTVTGLPFTAANNACEEIGTVNVKSPASALAGVSYLRVLNNGTEARLEQNSGTTTADHNCNANKIDTGTLLQGSITYLTA